MIPESIAAERRIGRVAFSEAMRSWFAGDFDGCLELCDRVRPHRVNDRAELALLRARALLRLSRPDDAIDALERTFSTAGGGRDAALTAQMLLGTAYVRRGELQRGIDILLAARYAGAQAHPTIRAEIALSLALGYYGLRALDDAERALDVVSPDADIVHARALELRGWIATARFDYAAATSAFSTALRRLDSCAHQDRFLEANMLSALAICAAERLDREAWATVDQRARRFDWSPGGVARTHYLVAYHASIMEEARGRVREALAWIARAEAAAPTPAARLFSRTRRAEIFRLSGERLAHGDLIARLHDAAEALADEQLIGEERNVLLLLAGELAACGDVLRAGAAIKRHRRLGPLPAMNALMNDPREDAALFDAEAIVARAAGDLPRARELTRRAFEIWRRVGYERRALLSAARLYELSGQAHLRDYVDQIVRKLGATSPLRTVSPRVEPGSRDPIVGALSPTERAVLALLCEGKSTAAIAAARNRSKQTIRNTVSRILTAFELPDRQALLRECMRRGLIPT
jgi:DNA-binding CsgD family transcriptional regulator